jgi:ketosteroid isomerase-like protein
MKMNLLAALVALALPLPAFAVPVVSQASVSIENKVAAAQQKLRSAILANDVDARLALYRPDARSMPEYQPALYGTGQIAAYHRAMRDRLKVTRYDPTTSEIFDFGNTAVEFGTFTAAWTKADGSGEERQGKYANVWAVENDGSLRLKADVWGYFENLPDAALHYVALPEASPPKSDLSPSAKRLAAILKQSNERDAAGVRERNTEARIAFYTDDAVIMPFADKIRRGMAEIRPYLTGYISRGSGISFDNVRVWNMGFEDFGDYVLEYSKFHVDWRLPDSKGVTKGGGLRLLKRQPDGSFKYHRQIGTHDYVQ